MGGYTLSDLCAAVHRKYLIWRAIDHLVCSDRFQQFYKEHGSEQLILKGDLHGVRKQMQEHFGDPQTYADLRATAASLKIVNYSRLSKGQLEKAIEKRSNEKSDS